LYHFADKEITMQIPFSFVLNRPAGTRPSPAPTPTPANATLSDLEAYPVLTEEIGYPPSPLSTPSSPSVPGSAPLGQIAAKAVSEVLGWKPKMGDVKGFVGALTQSFSLTDVEGHIESQWTPRTYAVQTDLAGGISGAQASVYARAVEALNRSLPLLDGLYPLSPETDLQDFEAIRAVARTQMNELVNEIGVPGSPRIARINQYFNLLLGIQISSGKSLSAFTTEPDNISGTLGEIRDQGGLWSISGSGGRAPLYNTVEEEQDVTNFRILSDYLTSLAQSWANDVKFLQLGTATPFFGTQLVLLSRQLSVVAESVEEVRFTLDSVFIGPAERQTTQINFPGSPAPPPMFFEDLLTWVQRFASEEGPRLIQEGGKLGVQRSFRPVVQELLNLVQGATYPRPINSAALPKGYGTPRVKRAMQELTSQLNELDRLANPIRIVLPTIP
jgi:hypothetical protein